MVFFIFWERFEETPVWEKGWHVDCQFHTVFFPSLSLFLLNKIFKLKRERERERGNTHMTNPLGCQSAWISIKRCKNNPLFCVVFMLMWFFEVTSHSLPLFTDFPLTFTILYFLKSYQKKEKSWTLVNMLRRLFFKSDFYLIRCQRKDVSSLLEAKVERWERKEGKTFVGQRHTCSSQQTT